MSGFYIAGRLSAVPEVQKIRDLVRDHGHHVTFDWTVTEEEGGEGEMRSSWKDAPERARQLSLAERKGVELADFLILHLSARTGGVGCWVEYGMAAAMHKPLWIMQNELYPRDSVFFYLPEVLMIKSTEMLKQYLTMAHGQGIGAAISCMPQ